MVNGADVIAVCVGANAARTGWFVTILLCQGRRFAMLYPFNGRRRSIL